MRLKFYAAVQCRRHQRGASAARTIVYAEFAHSEDAPRPARPGRTAHSFCRGLRTAAACAESLSRLRSWIIERRETDAGRLMRVHLSRTTYALPPRRPAVEELTDARDWLAHGTAAASSFRKDQPAPLRNAVGGS